ncbi:MAG: hypothetical protein Q9183_006919, partial [Haloplaca sp. 2 TL-2023]
VKCTQKIYHPNIDLEGNVCLNILREDWKPVLNLNAVIVGLQVRYRSIKASGTVPAGPTLQQKNPDNQSNTPSQFLFLEPNASDPLNKEAADDLRLNREGFKRNVKTSMGGGPVKGQLYERVVVK